MASQSPLVLFMYLKIYIVRYKVKRREVCGSKKQGTGQDSMTKINKIHLNIEIE
ncbi:hypothetical protein CV_2464 [Chromobacterium violaceum ATCC 12472]|uniref:Uncharacterized protein n=1 Tax=Chromobacterium violaceum (strain ATCC 12472 / DSM 30191 / JCM 1249 / CCUG 213 / NBRC 12614 / NCIMB 9131 / NCTC 9757 / MK) TaxID=243365 RepID=Q7NV80_CHRVO|nr:hypothetical protein CV_2464 [Chromobacterium violaceum ATCC 12472]